MGGTGAADRFWAELEELYQAAGSPPLSRLVKLGREQRPPIRISDATVNDWLRAAAVPSSRSARYFTVLVGFLQPRAAEHSGYEPRSEGWWRQLLAQAREERGKKRGGRAAAPKDPPAGVVLTAAPEDPPVSVGAPQPPGRRRWKTILVTAGTVGALAGLFLEHLTGVGSEAIDGASAKDSVRDVMRSDNDIRYSVTFLDEAYELVLPEDVELTRKQKKYLSSWSLDHQDQGGYGLDTLVGELREVGGANPQELMLRLTLEGRRNQPIRVDDVRPVNIRRRAPLRGTLLFIPPQGPGQTIKMMFDFDEVEPRARTAVDKGGVHTPGGLFFEDKTLSLTDGEEDALLIKSVATRSAVSFDVRVDYRIGDEAKHLVIDNNGHPFALTPMNCTDRTSLAEDGAVQGPPGRASYRSVWEMRDFQTIEPVTDPGHFTVGPPYC